MSRMEQIKAYAVAGNPKRKKTYETEAIRLKIAVMVVQLREQHCLSQQILAGRVSVSKSTIASIEDAKVDITVEMLNHIAQAVGKELEMRIV